MGDRGFVCTGLRVSWYYIRPDELRTGVIGGDDPGTILDVHFSSVHEAPVSPRISEAHPYQALVDLEGRGLKAWIRF